MGYYIQVPNNKGKAQQIVELYGAKIIPEPIGFWQKDPQEAFICVLDNGPFEAAGFAYNEREFEEFKAPDPFPPQRPRTWLVMNRKEACELTGFIER